MCIYPSKQTEDNEWHDHSTWRPVCVNSYSFPSERMESAYRVFVQSMETLVHYLLFYVLFFHTDALLFSVCIEI